MSDIPCPTGKHQFEARYDERPSEIATFFNRAPVVEKTYVRDVCVKCGYVVERKKP